MSGTVRIELGSKDRRVVLDTIREQGLSAFALQERWGLIEDAAAALEAFATRVGDTDSLWELAAELWVSPNRLQVVIQILSEACIQERLDRKSTSRLRSASSLSTAEVGAVAKTLGKIADAFGDDEFASKARQDAQLYGFLASSLRKWDPPTRGVGRPPEPASVIEVGLEFALGDRKPAERRRWTANLVSDFTGDATSTRQVREREKARARRYHQGG